MTQSALRHLAGAAAAALVVLLWASAAAAAPGKLCSVTRGWVERHCDKSGRLATPERCAKWLGWLDARCPADKAGASSAGADRGKAVEERVDRGKAAASGERIDRSKAVAGKRVDRSKADLSAERARSKARDDKGYMASRYDAPRPRKHAHKARPRVVYVYVERPPRRCCYSGPVLNYRTSPYRDKVFTTDHVLRRGKEAAFFRAYEAARQ